MASPRVGPLRFDWHPRASTAWPATRSYRPTIWPRSLRSWAWVSEEARGVIDPGVGAVLEQEAVADLVGIHVEAHDVAAVVDAEGDGRYGTGEGNRGEAAVRRSEIHPSRSRGIEIEADGLPASVDVGCRGLQGAGDVDRSVDPLSRRNP